MRQATLQTLGPLLDELRANSALVEIRQAEFLLHGRPFLHFHEDAHGVTADVLLSRRRVSVAATTAEDQAELLDQVYEALEALEAHERDRRRRTRQRRADGAG